MTPLEADYVETIIIGGGQAGLAAGYHLRRQGRPFLILDAGERTGDAWRDRWDSLRLFTPALFDSLPGMPFPAPAWSFPTKDEMGDYLERYAEHFGLPVRSGVSVHGLTREGERFLGVCRGAPSGGVKCHRRHRSSPDPEDPAVRGGARSPDRAASLGRIPQPRPAARRRHAARGRGQLGAPRSPTSWRIPGTASSRVGAPGNSRTPRQPAEPCGLPGLPVSGASCAQGRHAHRPQARSEIRSRRRPADQTKEKRPGREERRASAAGGWCSGRSSRSGGWRVIDVANVVWCTGFRTDFSWIELPVFDEERQPRHYRGVVESEPGLYFLGLVFQYSLSSDVLPNRGRDAAYIADHITKRSLGHARAADLHRLVRA